MVRETVSISFDFPFKRENEKAGKSTLFIDCAPSKLNRRLECNSQESSVFLDKQVSSPFVLNEWWSAERKKKKELRANSNLTGGKKAKTWTISSNTERIHS